MTLGGETSQTLDRGVRLLEILAADRSGGLTVSELAVELDVGRPVVYRLLATLDSHNLVRRFGDGRIRLGLGLIPLAAATHSVLRRSAEPVLRTLADTVGATAHLTIADGDQAIAVAVEEPRWTDFHVSYRVGSTHPVTRGAAGKAILAGREGRDELIVTRGELQQGATGYAAPILGVPGLQASVGVVTVDSLDEEQVRLQVRAAAVSITAALR